MIRSLYTGASGMRIQQNKMDFIGDNIANSSTVGFKKSRPDFKEALYDAMYRKPEGEGAIPLVGNGALVKSIQTYFTQGGLQTTNYNLDIALEGPGFFALGSPEGETLYSRNGNLKLSYFPGEGARLENTEGYPVLDGFGQHFIFPEGILEDDILIMQDGSVYLKDEDGDSFYQGTIGLYSFVDPQGLESIDGSYFSATEMSGDPIVSFNTQVIQGCLEQSNVEMAQEMTDLIMAQRAYQLNSRVVQTADEMEKLANNLRG